MSLPAAEFVEWQAYFSIYPFTQDREDARAAMIAAALVNSIGYMLGNGKALRKPVKTSDFLPRYLSDADTDSDPKQRAGYRAFAAQLKAVRPDLVTVNNGPRNPDITPEG